ncbi:MAG: LPS-assembly protein LptD [Gammaproteobacteria bacterium]|nr:LPS-assembly protein LptD [Gammaproteobacteria bacterium]
MPAYCEGSYVEPAFPLPRDADNAEQPIVANAQAAEYWVGDRAVLSGGVNVAQGNATASSREATYRESDEVIVVAGDVTVRQPGLLVYGTDAELAVRTGAAAINNAEFVLHDAHLRGTAATLRQSPNATLSVDQGRFTRCEPGDESWSITSRSVEIEDDATHGVARHAVLRAGKVPVFYTPYIRFPVTDERLSGFLFPRCRL